MKTTTLLGILLLSLFALGMASCSDDDHKFKLTPLSFEKSTYETPLDRSNTIMVRGGNRDYTLKVEDSQILDATVDLSSEIGCGNIIVNGKQKGETTLSVTDNATLETVQLQIKVTDNYLGCHIMESNHAALATDLWMYFIMNNAKEVYFFSMDKGVNAPTKLVTKGTYEFVEENKMPYLILTYAENDGKFTDAHIAPVPHKFNISQSDVTTFSLLKRYYQFNWSELDKSPRELVVTQVRLRMQDEKSNIAGSFVVTQIPEGILK